jgi:hypothetical protein
VASGIAVDGLTALATASVAALRRPRREELTGRSLLRLAAGSTSARAIAGVAANLLELTAHRRGGRLLTPAATLGSWGVAVVRIRHGSASAGSAPMDGREAEEDVTRLVSIPTAAALGPVVTLALFGVALAESALSSAAASAAAVVLGGTSNDRRTAGRAAALGVLAGVGYAGLSFATGKLTHAGERLENAHADPPTVAEATGGPGSTIPWTSQSRRAGDG